jgi:signal transduction histidine kinase
MPSDTKRPNLERDQTDESLRLEREKADSALEEKLAAIDETADAVISDARLRADAVVAAARAKTDQQAGSRPATAPARELIRNERLREDQAIREERADADQTVREERAEQLALLSSERQETDKDLLTERTQSDEVLATRDDFLAIVSHDLRDMLGVMVGFAGMIATDVSQPDRLESIRGYAERIQRAGARMNRLIGDLVDVASIEAGALAVTRELGDPAQVAREAVETFQTQAAAKALTLVAEIDPTTTSATFDAPRILQVLTNLLINAIKFTPADGKVEVRVDRAGHDIRFAVTDTGVGIPAEKLEAVFERFLQINPKERRGVGLGLYISKCIVHGHGGQIWAESTLGQGSRFVFTLPID